MKPAIDTEYNNFSSILQLHTNFQKIPVESRVMKLIRIIQCPSNQHRKQRRKQSSVSFTWARQQDEKQIGLLKSTEKLSQNSQQQNSTRLIGGLYNFKKSK